MQCKRVGYSVACGLMAGGLAVAALGSVATLALLFPKLPHMPQLLQRKWFGATVILSGLATATIAAIARRQLKPTLSSSSTPPPSNNSDDDNTIIISSPPTPPPSNNSNDDNTIIISSCDNPNNASWKEHDVPVPEIVITSFENNSLDCTLDGENLQISSDSTEEEWLEFLDKIPLIESADRNYLNLLGQISFLLWEIKDLSQELITQRDVIDDVLMNTLDMEKPCLRRIYLEKLKTLPVAELESMEKALGENPSLEDLLAAEKIIRKHYHKGTRYQANGLTQLERATLGTMRTLHYHLTEKIRKRQKTTLTNVSGQNYACLYRSISHGVYGDTNHHEGVKKLMLTAARDDPNNSGEDHQAMIRTIEQNGEAGDNDWCLRYLAEAFQRPIYLYENELPTDQNIDCKPRVYWPSKVNMNSPPLCIYLKAQLGQIGHFQSVNIPAFTQS